MQKLIGVLAIVCIGVVLTLAALRPQRTGPSSDQIKSFQQCMSAKRENYATVKAARMKVDPDRAMNPAFAFDEARARTECKRTNGIKPGEF